MPKPLLLTPQLGYAHGICEAKARKRHTQSGSAAPAHEAGKGTHPVVAGPPSAGYAPDPAAPSAAEEPPSERAQIVNSAYASPYRRP